MATELEQLIAKRLAELPKDVRAAIESADLEKRINEIGKANNLHIDQLGALQNETLLVMLGFSDPGEFPQELAKRLNLSPEAATAIAGTINEQVFMTIRDSMRAFMEGQGGGVEPPTPAPAAAAKPPLSAVVPKPPAPPAAAAPVQPRPMTAIAPQPKAPAAPSASPAPAAAPAPVPNPLARMDERLAKPTVSAAKPFDLSLKDKPQTPPAQKNYSKDPYREPIE